jgi:hypothetical protein
MKKEITMKKNSSRKTSSHNPQNQQSQSPLQDSSRKASFLAVPQQFYNSTIQRVREVMVSPSQILHKIEGGWNEIRSQLHIPTLGEVERLKQRVIKLEKKMGGRPSQHA